MANASTELSEILATLVQKEPELMQGLSGLLAGSAADNSGAPAAGQKQSLTDELNGELVMSERKEVTRRLFTRLHYNQKRKEALCK